ncbi:MAG: P1 family peptidase [Thermoplasmata archaeon]|nr:P1 family peptidase [Thermoplasmata archaeon]
MPPRIAPRRQGLSSVRVGHATTADGLSGVSVLLFGLAAPTVVDVRGGASGTYDTASLALDATFGRRWAIFFSGGSLFGLDAAAGVRDQILRDGGGQAVFGNPNRVAPVSGAILFDLPREARAPPDYRSLGLEAARGAGPLGVSADAIGAGAGARIGKYLGPGRSQPGAIALELVTDPDLGTIAALAAVNAVGAVRDPDRGRWIAGARDTAGRLVPPDVAGPTASPGTTLVALVTDVPVSRPVLQRVAAFAHTGLSRAVVPSHTATDGDAVFVTSVAGDSAHVAHERRTGETADRLGVLAERATVRAIVAAGRAANRRATPRLVEGGSRGGRG